ncbi:hypothetical protein [Sphingobacterium allocomposti]|nr:hypothetical protein [Sphingobacterium composti Yoo et al. 2007 non Ten et al. 2007]HLS96026.1 hypothetical protein [Sphingobacterium sp.]
MKRPKIFSGMSRRQYWAFKWFFVIPVSIYLLGRLIMLIVILLDR